MTQLRDLKVTTSQARQLGIPANTVVQVEELTNDEMGRLWDQGIRTRNRVVQMIVPQAKQPGKKR